MIKNKKVIFSIGVFVLFTLYSTLFNLNVQDFSYDRIWIFHMLQKIANGNQIYTEINVLVGPVFYIIGGAIFKLFGSNFIVYDILGGVMCGTLATLIYNITKEVNKYDNKVINFMMMTVLLFFVKYLSMANYNILVLIFILLAMYFEIRKSKGKGGKLANYLIGASLGLAFFTKQTVGGMAVIATGVISLIDGILRKKKNPIKEILEKAAGFFTVLIPIVLIMIFNGNFIAYIDLCFGSILEFGGNNFSFAGASFYLVLMLAILGSSVSMCKLKKDDTEFLVMTIYALAFIFFMFPIFNAYHMHIATLPIWFLIIKILNILLENDKQNVFKLFVLFLVVLFMFSGYDTGNTSSVSSSLTSAISDEWGRAELIKNFSIVIIEKIFLCILGVSLMVTDYKKIMKSFAVAGTLTIVILSALFINGLEKSIVPAGLEIYANHGFKNEKLEEISNIINYIENKEKYGYKVYGISWDASEYFAPMNRNNNKFDLLFSGNLGFNGTERVLEEIKTMEGVIFLKNKEKFWQEPKEIIEYIIQNCEKIDEIGEVEVYQK